MEKKKLLSIVSFIILLGIMITNQGFAQDRFKTIETHLKSLSAEVPGLDEKIDELSVSDVSIQTFLRGVSKTKSVNISIDPTLNITVVNNFSNVTVAELIMFLAKQYDLEINFIGTIITISKHTEAPKELPKATPRKLNITYNSINKTLTLDLKGDTLSSVTKEITKRTGLNVIQAPGFENNLISIYVQDLPFSNALDKMAYSNNMVLKVTDDSVYVFQKQEPKPIAENVNSSNGSGNNNKKSSQKKQKGNEASDFDYSVTDINNISLNASESPIIDIVKEIAQKLNINYYIYSNITDNTTAKLVNVSFDDLLNKILSGTKYTYRKEDGRYLIGERQSEGLRQTKVIQLQYRSIDQVKEYIPKDLLKDVELKEMVEQNSLIVSGSSPAINEIDLFIKDIDQIVPVVLIEVMIVEVTKNKTVQTTFDMGVNNGTTPTTTGGTVFPNYNYTTTGTSINTLLNSFNGFGSVNLGRLTPNFYVTLKALETNGIAKISSTPKLSTLNGHEAKLSIGKTSYYVETTQNTYVTASVQNTSLKQYKSVKADLSIKIKPFVSGDEQITLNIDVQQSDFTDKIEAGAPPNTVNRNFSSEIRLKNEEVVLLGGLESVNNNSTGSGVPFLARIPVLKWLFSDRVVSKSTDKLNIFIKPTIIY